jgi:hypothetical protein
MKCNLVSVHARRGPNALHRPDSGLRYILENGEYIQRENEEIVLLRTCDVPLEDRRRDSIARLIGTMLTMNPERDTVIKVQRCRSTGPRKQPYQRQGRRQAVPGIA